MFDRGEVRLEPGLYLFILARNTMLDPPTDYTLVAHVTVQIRALTRLLS